MKAYENEQEKIKRLSKENKESSVDYSSYESNHLENSLLR